MNFKSYKFDIMKQKYKPILMGVAGLAMAGISIYVAYASLNRRNVSVSSPESNIGAASASCLLNLTIKPPTTGTPPPPTTGGCVSFGIDEHSNQNLSNIVSIDNTLTVVKKLATHSAATDGVYNIEGMDNHPATGEIYAVANSNHNLYKVNKTNGSLTLAGRLNPQIKFSDLAFKKDGTLYGWSKGKGLYQISLNGTATLVQASNLSDVEGIAWDNSGLYMYLSRTPSGTTSYQLWQYNPTAATKIVRYGTLPRDTDTLDFAPSNYKGGYLMGAYETSSGVNFYSYNLATKRVVSTFVAPNKAYKNLDAMAICTTP